jgi:peptide/nickel transport system substrate-binding protein
MTARRAFFLNLVCFALVAAACDGGDDTALTTVAGTEPATTLAAALPTSTTTTTSAPIVKTPGGEVVVAVEVEPASMNPFVVGGESPTVTLLGNAIHRGVQRINAFTLEYEPDLVTELPSVANGGVVVAEDGAMTVTYQIRDEAVWSDGEPVSGADFGFTLELILDPDLPIAKAVYEDIISTEIGDKTFSFTLAQPTPRYEALFSVVVPRHAVAGTDFLQDWNTVAWPSNGPFVFAGWTPGESIRLERNPLSFRRDAESGDALPYLDGVILEFVGGADAAVNSLRIREVDVIQPSFDLALVEGLESLALDGVVTEVVTGADWEHLAFQFGPGNRNSDSLNADVDFRRAVAHAIDRPAIVADLFEGRTEALDSWLVSHDADLGTDAWSGYEFDPDRAERLIGEACTRVGRDCVADPPVVVFSTTSDQTPRRQLDGHLEEYLETVGIAYESDLERPDTFFGETFYGGTWDLGAWAWLGAPGLGGAVATLDVWDPATPCLLGGNCSRWGTEDSSVVDVSSERFAALVAAANATIDPAELIRIVQEAEQILADQVVIIPLHANLAVAAWWGDEVGGIKHQAAADGLTWNVGEWYRTDL